MKPLSRFLPGLMLAACLVLPAPAQTAPPEGTDDDELIVLSCCFLVGGPDVVDEDAADAEFLADIEEAIAVLTPGYLDQAEEPETDPSFESVTPPTTTLGGGRRDQPLAEIAAEVEATTATFLAEINLPAAPATPGSPSLP